MELNFLNTFSKHPGILFILLLYVTTFSACQNTYKINLVPDNAYITVNGEKILPNHENRTSSSTISIQVTHDEYEPYSSEIILDSQLSLNEISIELAKKKYTVIWDSAPRDYQIQIDNQSPKSPPMHNVIEHGNHTVALIKNNKVIHTETVSITNSRRYVIHYPETQYSKSFPITKNDNIQYLGSFPTGIQPKQVVFSPDSSYLYIPLLADTGFDIYQFPSISHIQKKPGGPSAKVHAFVEGLFLPDKNTFFITQMFRNKIIEYSVEDLKNPELLRELNSHGTMPKVVAYSSIMNWIAVSNWLENSVVIMDYKTGRVIHTIYNLSVPRGIAFSPDSKFIYIASFEGGFVTKHNTETWKEAGRIRVPSAAMRHIVQKKDGKTIFVSDMAFSKIYEIDTDTFTIKYTYTVFSQPNTIDITPNDQFLFVSCRGPNNPKSYLLPSIYPGKVVAYDISTREMIAVLPGGRQPTGLDISPDGRYLVFSNFQDNDIDVYNIEGLYSSP